MSTEPVISVIIPYYQSGRYLQRCLDSVTGQNYRALEILLVDDGSGDDSPRIAEGLAARDDRIRHLHIPHGGVSVARNTGLAHASGKYVTFVDSDDWLADGVLRRMVTGMEASGADLVTCELARVDSPEDCPKPECGREELVTRDVFMRLFFRIGSNDWVHYPVAKLYRRDLLTQPLFPAGIRIGEDVVGTYLATGKLQRILRIRETGYYYYTNPESATSRFSDRDFDLIRVWDLVVRSAAGREPDAAYAQLNRDRLNFTLLFRMVTELSRDEIRRNYPEQEKQLRTQLRACEKELLQSPIVRSRKVLILLLSRCYPLMSALGNLSVRIRRCRGKQTGFFRRK